MNKAKLLDLLKDLPPDKVPFVWMPCGCIGIKLHGDVYLSIWNCDSDSDHPSMSFSIRQHNPMDSYPKDHWQDRYNAGKQPFTPIPKERFIELLETMQYLSISAHVLFDLRSALKWTLSDER